MRKTRKKKKRGGAFGGLRMRPVPKGRTVEPRAREEVRALLGDAPRRDDLLIEYLHRIQDHYGHLSPDHLAALAVEMRLAYAEVYEVATFYAHFDVLADDEPSPPALTVRVCESIACEMAGAQELLETLGERLGDRVRVIPAPCVGRCAEAPVAVVGRNPVGAADVEAVEEAVLDGRIEAEAPDYVDYAAYRADGGYALLASLVAGERPVEEVMETVAESGLQGLGGAGFPSARKWHFVRTAPGRKVLALNADEGEPGTYKDRYFLETDPHRVLEGMLIAAWAVDAEDVYLYLRDEYAAIRGVMERELELLESDPPCALPTIHLRRGAGAYICGEETALIESIEGKRGEPRLRPPYPAQNGVFGRPTLVHNVETVYWLRRILESGAEAFAAAGKPGHKGERGYSVSGRVRRPGVYIAPNGTTVRELIEMAGGMLEGHTFYAYLPGGASGGILPASLGDVPLDFGTLDEYGCFIGSAAIVVLSDRDSVRSAALNLMKFFSHESCGKCTPCRAGTAKSVDLLSADRWDTALLDELGRAMADASICGLGQAAPNSVRSVVRYFPEELER